MPPPEPTEHQFRENSRAPVEAPVRLQFEALEEPQEGQTANISVGGIFVKARNPKPVGTILRFELDLGDGEPIKGVGEVVWIRAHSQGAEAPAGLGIQFGHLDESNRARLKEVVLAELGAVGVDGLSEPSSRRIETRPSPPRRPVPNTESVESKARPAAPKRRRPARPSPARGSRSRALRTSSKSKKTSTAPSNAMTGRTKMLIIILGLLLLFLIIL